MRLLHLSDTHGAFPALADSDVVVHSGDFCPNSAHYKIPKAEESFQGFWLTENSEAIARWLGGRPLLLTRGNHDFVDVARVLGSLGIEVVNLEDRIYVHDDGISFYGFPWIPQVTRDRVWNFEASREERRERMTTLSRALDEGKVDVIVAHSPPHGILDRFGSQRCGSRLMRQMLTACTVPPVAYLCGHIHEDAGVAAGLRGIVFSNAAMTQRTIDLNRTHDSGALAARVIS